MAVQFPLSVVIKAVDRFSGPFRVLRGGIGGVGSALRGITIAGTAAVAAVAALTVKSAITGDKFAKTADKLGLGVGQLQELAFAADRVGVPFQTLERGFRSMIRAAGDASRGSAEMQDLFEALGVDPNRVGGGLRRGVDLLDEIAERFKDLEPGNETAKLALADRIFGGRGSDLIRLLNLGSEGIGELRTRFRELGGAISVTQARDSEAFLDMLTDLKTAAAGLGNAITSRTIPAVTRLGKALTDALVDNQPEFEGFMLVLDQMIPIALRKIENGWNRIIGLDTNIGELFGFKDGLTAGTGGLLFEAITDSFAFLVEIVDQANAALEKFKEIRDVLTRPSRGDSVLEGATFTGQAGGDPFSRLAGEINIRFANTPSGTVIEDSTGSGVRVDVGPLLPGVR